jgi:hypothetical protein
MADRQFSRVQALNKQVKIIAGRLKDDDTAQAGLGWSGADTGTGVYTITLDDSYNALLSMTANIQSTAGTDDFVVSIASHDVSASTAVIVLHVAVAGTLTDIGTGDEIHFTAILQNSTLPSV